MTSGLAISLTLLVWWLGTGAVFVAARGGSRRRRWAFGAATAMLGVALSVLPSLSARSDLWGALLALGVGFTAWAWVELSFYTGYVTGPSKRVPPPEASLAIRFRHALAACLWHEITIPLLALVVAALSGDANPWALRIYLTFWVLHEVARINVLIGVPHPFAELLPRHLSHLTPYLEPRRAGWPILVTLLAHVAGAAWLAWAAVGHGSPAELLGWAAMAALVSLGWLEHLVLMLPIPLERLWRRMGMGNSTASPAVAPKAVPLR